MFLPKSYRSINIPINYCNNRPKFSTIIISIITSFAFTRAFMSIVYMSKHLCIILFPFCAGQLKYVYECIVNVCYVNPANDMRFKYLFPLCHGPGYTYNHHLHIYRYYEIHVSQSRESAFRILKRLNSKQLVHTRFVHIRINSLNLKWISNKLSINIHLYHFVFNQN